jgi:uncharacterized membrane protein
LIMTADRLGKPEGSRLNCRGRGAPLPDEYHRIFWLWFAFGIPAFTAVGAILWLMIARPQIELF